MLNCNVFYFGFELSLVYLNINYIHMKILFIIEDEDSHAR